MYIRVLPIIAFILSRATTKVTAALIGFLLFLQGCDDEETGDAEVESGAGQPSRRGFLRRDAGAASGRIPAPGGGGCAPGKRHTRARAAHRHLRTEGVQ